MGYEGVQEIRNMCIKVISDGKIYCKILEKLLGPLF